MTQRNFRNILAYIAVLAIYGTLFSSVFTG